MSAPVIPVLLANAAVTAVFGSAPLNVFPGGFIPQEVTARPVATYQTVSGGRDNTNDGGKPPLEHALIQIDVWGTTAAQVESGIQLIIDALCDVAALKAYNASCLCVDDYGKDYEPETMQYRESRGFSFQMLL
jgi:hypothetical protein